jgi:hypothetical protein
MSLKREMMDEIRDVQKLWSSFAIVLGIALILTAWLPTDLSAGSKGPVFGKAGATENSGINKSPQESIKVRSIPTDPYKVRSIPSDPHKVVIPSQPVKVRNTPTDPSASGGNDRGIIIVSGKGGKDASTTLDAKKIQQGIKINPGGPVELNPQPLPPKAFRRSIKIKPGDAVGLNPQPLPPK